MYELCFDAVTCRRSSCFRFINGLLASWLTTSDDHCMMTQHAVAQVAVRVAVLRHVTQLSFQVAIQVFGSATEAITHLTRQHGATQSPIDPIESWGSPREHHPHPSPPLCRSQSPNRPNAEDRPGDTRAQPQTSRG